MEHTPAFPQGYYSGFTKLEFLIGMAMQGLLANPEFASLSYGELADMSLKHALAVLAAVDKSPLT